MKPKSQLMTILRPHEEYILKTEAVPLSTKRIRNSETASQITIHREVPMQPKKDQSATRRYGVPSKIGHLS